MVDLVSKILESTWNLEIHHCVGALVDVEEFTKEKAEGYYEQMFILPITFTNIIYV